MEADTVQLQTVSAERSARARPAGRWWILRSAACTLTGLLKTVAGGNADTNNFNGQRTDQMNFTVDGQVVIDSGVNALTVQRINVDAITEFKSIVQQHGSGVRRNSGAGPGGYKRAAGALPMNGYRFKCGQFMNANTFVNNATGVPRQ